jgi:hypothetical protein
MHTCEAGCGRNVSDNKLYCFECVSKPPTVTDQSIDCVLVRLRQQHVDTLCRVSDGMMIAQRQQAMVLVGTDLGSQARHVFMDEDAAIRFIRTLANITEERDGDSLIQRPTNGLVPVSRH